MATLLSSVYNRKLFCFQCKPEYKVPGLYVIDSIVRQSRHQFGTDKDVFGPRFSKNITATFQYLYLCPSEDKVRLWFLKCCQLVMLLLWDFHILIWWYSYVLVVNIIVWDGKTYSGQLTSEGSVSHRKKVLEVPEL